MEKKKMVLCTRIPEKELEKIKQYCDITEAGELLHGKGNSTEETLREECMGKELVVLGDEPAGAETLSLGGIRHEVSGRCQGYARYRVL